MVVQPPPPQTAMNKTALGGKMPMAPASPAQELLHTTAAVEANADMFAALFPAPVTPPDNAINGTSAAATSQRSQEFDPKEFVQQYRRRIPLPQLQKILNEKHEAVKADLVELINEKYGDFVSLSSKMKELEHLTQPILEPLKENRALCEEFTRKLDELCSRAREGIRERKRIAERKRLVLGLQENLKLLAKTKQTLDGVMELNSCARGLASNPAVGAPGPGPAGPPAGVVAGTTLAASSSTAVAGGPPAEPQQQQEVYADDFLRKYGLLEFVAGRIRKMNFAASTTYESSAALAAGGGGSGGSGGSGVGESSPADDLDQAVRDFRKDLASFRELFLAEITAALKTVLGMVPSGAEEGTSGAHSVVVMAFTHVSRAFLLLGAEAEFVRVFSSVFVDSVLEEAQSKIQGLSVKKPHAFLKAAAPGLNLVADGIGRAVLEHLGKTMNNIFIPTGVLDVFAENYVAYSNFTRQIEGLLSSSDEQAYWKAEVAEKWQRKWQINVYFSIREKELTYQFSELSASSRRFNTPGNASNPGTAFHLPASDALKQHLFKLWSRERSIYLGHHQGLFAKFLNLSLKLFAEWVAQVPLHFIQTLQAVAANTTLQGANQHAVAWPQADAEKHGPLFIADLASWKEELNFGAAVLRSRSGAAAPAAEADPSGKAFTPPDRVQVNPPGAQKSFADVLLNEIVFSFSGQQKQSDGGTTSTSDGLLTLTDQLFEDTRAELDSASEKVTNIVLKRVQEKINEVLYENVKRIPSLYRMMNKPTPANALPYVKTLLAPLEELYRYSNCLFFRAMIVHGRSVFGDMWDRAPWQQHVVHETAFQFESQAASVCDQVAASYRSLQRVNSLQKNNSAEDDQAKILQQLRLDVAEFLRIARGQYGVADAVVNVKQLEEGAQ
eukprot:g14785.t1